MKGILFLLLTILQKEDVVKEVKHLDASQQNDTPKKIIQENAEIFPHFMYQSFNNMTVVCILLASLKLANITPFFKKRPRSMEQ